MDVGSVVMVGDVFAVGGILVMAWRKNFRKVSLASSTLLMTKEFSSSALNDKDGGSVVIGGVVGVVSSDLAVCCLSLVRKLPLVVFPTKAATALLILLERICCGGWGLGGSGWRVLEAMTLDWLFSLDGFL